MKSLWSLAILVALIASCRSDTVPPSATSRSASVKSISVAAASDLKFAFEDLVAEFHRAHPEIAVVTTYGSSGNFYTQLSNKAPFDIFFSADLDYPRKLIEQGDGVKETEFQYAIGHIGIWVRNDSPLDIDQGGLSVLKDPSVVKIAIANPRFAPYGRAAEAALKHFDIYDAIKDRLVLGDNIAQTAQFIETGAADVGIIAASLATASPLKEKGRFQALPKDSHPVLLQGGVIMTWATDRQACESLRAFVTSEKGKSIFRSYGFDSTEIQ